MANGCSAPPFLQTSYPRLAIAGRICRSCCDTLDRAYYEGADGDEIARLAADRALRDCMQQLADAGAVDPESGQALDEEVDGPLLWEQQRLESP